MKKKFYTIWTVLMLVALTVSPAYAGAIRLSGSISKGSLDFNGLMTGVGGYKQGVTVTFNAFGKPIVKCTGSDGDTGEPEHNIVIQVHNELQVPQSTITFDKGKVPVGIKVDITDAQLPAPPNDGCQKFRIKDPDDIWKAHVVDTIWTRATIDIYNGATISSDSLLRHQEYTCDQITQTKTFISCSLTLDQSFH